MSDNLQAHSNDKEAMNGIRACMGIQAKFTVAGIQICHEKVYNIIILGPL